MKRLVSEVWYNYFALEECGENYSYRKVGKDGVVKIAYHQAKYDGDQHYVDIYKNCGFEERIFNLNHVKFL